VDATGWCKRGRMNVRTKGTWCTGKEETRRRIVGRQRSVTGFNDVSDSNKVVYSVFCRNLQVVCVCVCVCVCVRDASFAISVTPTLLLCWYGVKLAALGSEMWYLSCMNAVWCGKIIFNGYNKFIFELIKM